ncbi:MAG: hypothetical protein IPH60_00015 [Flavobacteriales bacterium]|nr:hypothetical protein [Flavobacteriales bacterium]
MAFQTGIVDYDSAVLRQHQDGAETLARPGSYYTDINEATHDPALAPAVAR